MPTNEQGLRLPRKGALILGASSSAGIGYAIAKRFIREGAKVVVGGRDREKMDAIAKELGAVAVECDIIDESSISSAIAEAKHHLGYIDIAVNAAGVNRAVPIAEETADGLLEQAKVHFVGTALFIRDVAEAMDHGGSIITISTLTAELTSPRLAAYAATKSAADKLIKVAAVEYGDRNIRLNSLAPGLTSTGMTAGYFANEKILGAFLRETPTGQLATPDDVAAAAVWLASDECHATGDLVRVSGGMHLRRLPVARDFA